jgi:drug/metabolite transporter (DMT)-like permease
LKEIPTGWQWMGLVVAVIGSGIFFAPGMAAGDPVGIGIVAFGLIGFGMFGILGREVARDGEVGTLALTAYPLAFGGGLLVLIALLLEGLPHLTLAALGVVLWLAVINTAIAYILYNHSLQVMTAFEMNMLVNLAPFITAVYARVFLGERLEPIQFFGMIVMVIGVVLVQRGRGAARTRLTNRNGNETQRG